MTTRLGTPDKDAGELMPLVVLHRVQIAHDIVQLARLAGAEVPPFSRGWHAAVDL